MALREAPAVQVTGHLQYQAWQDRSLPPVEQLRPGVASLPVPFDGAIRYTLCYVLSGPQGVLLVDPGGDDPPARATLQAGLAGLGIGLQDVRGVVVTHFHLDHLDLAHWVAERSGAWIGMHQGDLDVLHRQQDHEASAARDRAWLVTAGAPPEVVDSLLLPAHAPSLPPDPAVLRVLQDQEDLTPVTGVRATVLHTPGHSPGHVCVHLPDHALLLTGDHVLPRISGSVGFGGRRPADPLGDHRRSLQLLAGLTDVEAGPAHEYRFTDLPARLAQLLRQHDERSDEVERTYRSGRRTIWDVAEAITWSRGWDAQDAMNRRLALNETEAHLTSLARQGRIDWVPLDEDYSNRC